MQGINTTQGALVQQATGAQHNKVFTMRKSAGNRMGGSVPVWSQPHTPKQNIAENLQTSLNAPVAGKIPAHSQAYAPTAGQGASEEEFGFADLVDMVNPLQHIPLVNLAYREITGDEIKPIAKIVGGAVFGGPVGAASGLVDVAVHEETGKDMSEHALSLAKGEGLNSSKKYAHMSDRPEARLSAATEELGSAVAFADLSKPTADGRTAGHTAMAQNDQALAEAQYRAYLRAEPITELQMKPMPAKQEF